MYRVVTFQSRAVVDILRTEKYYEANINLAREGSINAADIATCGGKTPIWVFQHPALKDVPVGVKQMCDMLFTFKCEMSIDTLGGLYMLELHLNYQPPVGTAHNGSSLACIIPSISIRDVAAIYSIEETEHFYFYSVTRYLVTDNAILFPCDICYTKELYTRNTSENIRLADYQSANDYYK